MKGWVSVYTDGACSKNGSQRAQAGIGVYWGPEHALNVSEPVEGDRATNNVGEIQAVTRAVKLARANGITRLKIRTDSQVQKLSYDTKICTVNIQQCP